MTIRKQVKLQTDECRQKIKQMQMSFYDGTAQPRIYLDFFFFLQSFIGSGWDQLKGDEKNRL